MVFERLKIPQVDYYSFGERLAVAEQPTTDPSSIGYVMERLADLLASDFRDIESAFGAIAEKPQDWEIPTSSMMSYGLPLGGTRRNWEFDIYVSYSPASGGALDRWISAFVDTLREYLFLELPERPRVFMDRKRLISGDSYPEDLSDALSRSKLLLALLTPAYFESQWSNHEWDFFEEREKMLNSAPLIIPVLLRGGDWAPPKFRERANYDVSEFVGLGRPNLSLRQPKMAHMIQNLASQLGRRIRAMDDDSSS